MWIYALAEAKLIHFSSLQSGTFYSGFGACKNDPLSTHIPNLGPIPCGAWFIGPERLDEVHGPVAMPLIPLTGTETYHRAGFLFHADSINHAGCASHGCICAEPRTLREKVSASSDRLLIVVPSLTLVTA